MLALLALLSFITGFAVHRGTNCSVVAAHQLVRRRDPTRLASFIAGAAAALAVTAPFVWSDPGTFKTAPNYGLTWAAAIGGALYGFGVLLNGACALGTFVRISEGRLGFLAALPGIGIGAYLSTTLKLASNRGEAAPAIMAEPNALAMAALISAAIIALAALIATTRRIGRAQLGSASLLRASRWRPVMAMLVTGAAGGLAFAISASWAWPALVRRLSETLSGGPVDFPAPMLIGPVALFAGGLAASWLSGRFRVRARGWQQPLRSLAGGVIMGASAALIPGGNDVMLLSALPSLAVSGIVAYAAMFAVLVPALALLGKWRVLPVS